MAKICLYVYSKKKTSKDGKKSWIDFHTEMNLVKKGEEEKGAQHLNVDVVFKDKEERAKIEKMTGRIKVTVEDTELSAPTVYAITKKKREDGTEYNSYPKVFINHFIEAVSAPKPVPQNLFTQDEEVPEELQY